MQIMRTLRAPALRRRSRAETALPPVASIGSIISTKLRLEIGRQLRIITRRHRGQLVALQPDVSHPRRRQQLEDGIEHAEARTEHGHDDHIAGDAAALCRTERRSDRGRDARHIARRFGRKQQADADGNAAKELRRRPGVPERRERIVDQRVRYEVERHRFTIQNGSGKREKEKRIRSPVHAAHFRGGAGRRRTAFCPSRAPARLSRHHRRDRRHGRFDRPCPVSRGGRDGRPRHRRHRYPRRDCRQVCSNGDD